MEDEIIRWDQNKIQFYTDLISKIDGVSDYYKEPQNVMKLCDSMVACAMEECELIIERRKNVDIGTFHIDVQIMPNRNYDVYVAHDGCSGEHHIDVTADKIGAIVADYIECIAEEYKE